MFYLIVYLFLSFLAGCTNPYQSQNDDRIINAISSARFQQLSEGPKIVYRTLTEQERVERKLNSSHKGEVLDATGLCPGDQYTLYAVNQAGDILCLGEYIVSNQLQLLTIQDNLPITNHLMDLKGFMKGEIISFALICNNKNLNAGVVVSPNPIETSWTDGATISVTSTSKQMEMFILEGKGFIPNEQVRFISESWDEVMENEYVIESDGLLTIILAPMTKGKDGGLNRISLERLSTGQKRQLVIPYGSFAKQYCGINQEA